jgi:hypothetical protein
VRSTGAPAALVCLLALTGIAPAAASSDSRQAPCAEAWSLLAQQGGGLDSADQSAWARVSDGFLSMSDASFDGPLSNAFGAVSAAASDLAALFPSETEGIPSRAAFDSALAGLGGVCAHLKVSQHRMQVLRFQRFSYQTGTFTGLSVSAATRANATIGRTVDRAVQSARRANGSECMAGAKSCGYFAQTLKQRPCLPGMICIAKTAGLLPVGANDGAAWVTTVVLDGRTGRSVPLSMVLPTSEIARFIKDLNAAVNAKLTEGGIGNDAYWTPRLTIKDVRAWLPQPGGIHVWFDKYQVAPGNFGIVHVVVPWPPS